jgi:LysR family transcriptional regulator for metE and metH
VASRRGIAALPNWTVQSYLERDYVLGKPIGKKGLWSALYAATTAPMATSAFMLDFLDTVRSSSFRNLRGLQPLS